jgi:TP901 family phage tail tape measure protein
MAEDANARIRVDIDTAAALANIKNLQRQISAFHTSLAKSGAAANASSMQMQQSLINSINKTGQFSATIKNVKTTTDSFTNSLEKNKFSMGEYFRYSGAATKTFGRFFKTEFETINKVARERVKDLQTQYIKLGRDANGAMRAIAVRPLTLDMQNLSTKTQIAAQKQALLNQMLKQGSTNLLNFGKNTQWAGRQLMVGFTIPLVMFGSAASKTFMDMEKQVIRFKKVYGEMFTTDEETERALENIKKVSNEFTKYGIAVKDTLRMAADAAQTGLMGKALETQVIQATRLGVLGDVDQDQALKTTIALQNAFRISTENLAETIDFLNSVENQTVLSLEDVSEAIPRVGPIITELGGDIKDLAFFLTAMKEGGVSAAEGANALKSGLGRLINPSRNAVQYLEQFNINLTGIIEANAGDLRGTVMAFAEAIEPLDNLSRTRAVEKVFGKFQFARTLALLNNITREGTQAQKVLELTNATAAELSILSERELKMVEDSPMFKFQKALEDIKVTLVPLGEAFLKAVTPILEFGTRILKKFDELDDGAKNFVVGLTAIAGVIGPVFLMGFGLIANGVANVIKGFVFFKTAMNKAATSSSNLGMQTEYMTQQQLEASAVAASLDQVHQRLRQTFTSEAIAVNNLTAAYRRSIAAQGAMAGGAIRRTRPNLNLASGIMSVPGPRGAGDVVPAMLSPGEAVIPARQSKKYRGIISSLIADNVPGFRFGRNPFASMLGRSKVAVRMRDSDFSSELAASGKSARYKSAFDTQTGADYIMRSGSKTTRQRELRSAMERDVFGLDPKTTPTSARPTYGYARTPILSSFINKLFGIKGKNFNAVTRNLGESALGKYGNIDLVTKGSVAKRSSAFAGDALVNYHWAAEAQSFKRRAADLKVRLTRTGVRPAPMKGASAEQLGSFDRLGSPFKRYDNDPPPYVETYTPGGFAFKEIDRIIVNNPAIAKRLKDELRAAGLGGVRVTGSNFVERLFNQMRVPGYYGGTESVGPLTEAAAKKFAEFKKESISTTQDKTRGATASISKAHESLTYSNAQKELDDFIKIYKEQARADGVPEEKIQGAVKKYKRAEVSHIAKDTRTVMMDGTPVEIKNWRSANLVRDFGAVNQLISHIEQTNAVDANGKKILGKKLIPSLDPKEIAAMAGISEREAKKELKRLGRGEHPITARSSKVLMAVADKYLLATKSTTGPARMKALKHILAQRIANGSFFAAAQSGQLSLPKKLQADFDKKELKKQNTYLETREGGLKKARSQLIGPGSGVSKPAKVKRVGGSTKDTKLKLLAPGETVLTNKTTDNLRKGGTSSIPGVGKIRGMGKFGPIRVAGAYDGIPEGQTQDQAPRRQQARDPVTGRFVSSKAPASPAPTSRSAGMGGKIAGGASMAGMGAMMYGMSGGPGADLAMMASMPLMMAPMLGKLALLILPIAALVVAAIALKGAFDKAQKEAMEMANTLGAGKDAIMAYSEFAGTASAGEIRDRQRRDAASPFTIQQGKTTFGEAFVSSEQGKSMLDSLRKNVGSTGSAAAQAQLVNQLGTAVASGALSEGQARSIAASLAQELGDASFGISVNAKLIDIFGPNGENLINEPLEVRVKMIQETQSQLDAVANTTQPQMTEGTWQAGGGAALTVGGTALAVAGGLAVSAALAQAVPVAGQVYGAIAITTAGVIALGAGIWQGVEGMAKMGEVSGTNVAMGMIAMQQQKEMVDSLDLEYQKRIAIAVAAGDVAKAEELTTRHIQEREALLVKNAETTKMVLDNFSQQGFFEKMAYMDAVKKAVDVAYEDDPIMAQIAKGTTGQINSAALDDTQKYQMTLMLASKELDPIVATQLLNSFGSDSEQLTRVLNIMTNIGSADGNRAISLMNRFVDKDNKPLPDEQRKFLASIEAKTPASAQKSLAMFEEVAKLGGANVIDTSVIMSFYNNNPQAMSNMEDMIEKINSYGGKLDMNFVQNLVGAAEFEAFKQNQEYFEKLDPEQRKDYVSAFVNTMALEGDPAMQDAFRLWLTQPGNANKMFEEFAVVQSVRVTEAGIDSTAKFPEEEDPGSGGSGPEASSLDDILKKLRDIRKNQVGVAKGFEASAAAINKLFGGGAGINLFSGIENDMRRLGAEENLIDLIVGMSPEDFEKQKNTLFNFDKQTGEIIGFKDQLQNIGRALSAIALGQYVTDQQRSAKESRNQVLAFNQLRAAGYSVADAYEAVQDAAVASAIATGNVTRDQMTTMLQELRSAQEAMREAARLTPEGLQEVFEDGFNKAMEAFDVKEKKLTLDYEFKIKDDKALIDEAQNQIASIQYELDDYEADLRRIEIQEEAINKTYDDKLEALEKVRNANQKILDQEKGRLSVAEAITRGDLSATARAIQDLRATSASGYFSSQTDALNAGRQSALDQVRSENGLSRIEIEEKIKDLTNTIFEIEEKTLEPAQRRIDLATIELQKRISEEKVLERTRGEWEEIKTNIDLARVNSAGYKSAMDEALAVVQDVLDAWNEIEKPKETIHTIITVREGDASGGYTGPPGPGSNPDPLDPDLDTPAAQANRIRTTLNDAATAGKVSTALRNAAGVSNSTGDRADALINSYLAKITKSQADAILREAGLLGGPAPTTGPKGSVNNPHTTGISPGMSIPNGKAVITVPLDSYVKMPKGFYIQNGMVRGNVIDLWYGTQTQRWGQIKGNTVKAARTTPYDAYAVGGFVSGPGTPTSDSIPALLSDGEYVVKASSVDKFGTGFLDSINAGQLPGYRLGGLIRDGGGSSKSKPAPKPVPVPRGSFTTTADRAAAAQRTSAKTAKQVSAQAQQEAAAQRQRDALYKQGGFQGFEAGFGSLMASVGKNPIVQAVGNYINSSPQIKSIIAALSIPVETIGAVAKNFIESGAKAYSQASQGDFIGAAGTMALNALTVMPKSLFEGTANAFSGVLDSNNARPSMFEQANQAAYDANLFNAQNNPEMAALGRIIGGSLNIGADPLTYLAGAGVVRGVASLGAKVSTAVAARTTRVANKPKPDLMDNEYRIASIKEEFASALANPAIVTRRSVKSVEAMLKDNKTRTLFDTGTSAALADKNTRALFEAASFGSENVGNIIYGYLANKQRLTTRLPFFPQKPKADTFNPFSWSTRPYGDTLIELKKSFLEKVSLTTGDSLDNFMGANPLKPGIKNAGFITRDLRNANPKDLQDFAKTYKAGDDAYIEAQFPRFNPRLDIKTIWMAANDARTVQLRDTIKQLGLNIPVKVAAGVGTRQGSVLGNALAKTQKFANEIKHRFNMFKSTKFDFSEYNPFTNKWLRPEETLAKGGLVKPRFFANGGFVGKGADTVPAMLSPGEYVIKSQRVKDLGTRLFDNINSGSLSSVQSMSSPSFSSGSSSVSLNQSSVPSRQAAASSSNSVYNYSLSVNVASQADPNTIAQTVMAQLQRVDSQRVRNGRF